MTTPSLRPFHGSYLPEDIEFLLTPTAIAYTSVEDKERLIASGERHYSEMISREEPPSSMHKELFASAQDAYGTRLASDVCQLALALLQHFQGKPIVLVSLVRAGVPLGVLLKRALARFDSSVDVFHYGVSIIRDRGIDERAMREIEQRHGTESIVFVDGWTGKGAIASQLTKALSCRQGYSGPPRLVVLTDPGGQAWLSASYEDWLIPFGIMGAPISGLTSRSIWQDDTAQYHGVILYTHLEQEDISLLFVNDIERLMTPELLAHVRALPPLKIQDPHREMVFARSAAVMAQLEQTFQITNRNLIKPSIAEASRAVMRRVPDQVLISSREDPDVALLIALAQTHNVTLVEVGDEIAPYRAVTLIKAL